MRREHSTDNGAQPWSQIVEEQTAVALTSSVDPSLVGQSVTFTATVAALNGGGIPPDGTVIVSWTGGGRCSPDQPVGGEIAYTTATLASGSHPITAVYSGDATNEILGETLAELNEDCAGAGNDRRDDVGQPMLLTAPR